MSVAVKVCGLREPEHIDIACEHGARYVGFIFYPPSPRSVTAELAGSLVSRIDGPVDSVGVFVDPQDEFLDRVLDEANLDILQLHGGETPERVCEVRERTGKRVMKAIKVADREDLEQSRNYTNVTDLLLLDAKAPKTSEALPGGNGLQFDWRILSGQHIELPWLLAGGITADNMKAAVELTGARGLDVSSGIERSPGEKSSSKMRELLENAKQLIG